MNARTMHDENEIVEVSVTEIIAAEGELAGVCTLATVCVEATSKFIDAM